MKFNKATLAVAVGTTLGGMVTLEGTAVAALVADGAYDLVVLATPIVTNTTSSGATSTGFKFGKDGAWSSSFTFGGPSPGASNGSQAMLDQGQGDTYAGNIGIVVSGGAGAVTVTDFQKDGILATAGGTFSQFMGTNPTTSMIGSFGAGAQSLTMTLRQGSTTSPSLSRAWNIDDADCVFTSTTGAQACTNNGSSVWTPAVSGASVNDATTINGAVMTAIGDINGDSVTDYSGVLIHSGNVGSTWTGFFGVNFHEVWNVQLLSQPSAPIPVPAAVWLFGSGLLGLVGVARRRKSK